MTARWRTLEFVVRIPVLAERASKTGIGNTIERAINQETRWPLSIRTGRARVAQLDRVLAARKTQEARKVVESWSR